VARTLPQSGEVKDTVITGRMEGGSMFKGGRGGRNLYLVSSIFWGSGGTMHLGG